jgi:hypothetical protein
VLWKGKVCGFRAKVRCEAVRPTDVYAKPQRLMERVPKCIPPYRTRAPSEVGGRLGSFIGGHYTSASQYTCEWPLSPFVFHKHCPRNRAGLWTLCAHKLDNKTGRDENLKAAPVSLYSPSAKCVCTLTANSGARDSWAAVAPLCVGRLQLVDWDLRARFCGKTNSLCFYNYLRLFQSPGVALGRETNC